MPFEWRHDTLPEHADGIERFRTALVQNALDEAGHRRNKVLWF
jgi:hypothetical protein